VAAPRLPAEKRRLCRPVREPLLRQDMAQPVLPLRTAQPSCVLLLVLAGHLRGRQGRLRPERCRPGVGWDRVGEV